MNDLIKELEEELLKPDVRKSPERMGELLADDFFEFGASGKRYSKKEIIEILPTLPESNLSLSDFETIELAPDTILATYRAFNEKIQRKSLRSSIWKNIDGNWQMIFHQGTIETA
ncbi:DUF4440 domain-containing protein [Patescibacteria group bacterium]